MSTLKDIYDIIKELNGLVKEYQNQEMADKVVAIQECFFDLREELADLKDENRQLKEEIIKLNDISELEKDLELDTRGFLIRKSEKESGKNIRYCAACWQNYKKLMPIIHTIGAAQQCSNCKLVIR